MKKTTDNGKKSAAGAAGFEFADPAARARARSRVAGAVALAEDGELRALLDGLGELPPFEYLRRPGRGLVMLRGRAGGTGRPFNLGEAAATRCSIKILGRAGHGCCLGDDPARALAAALADGLLQDGGHAGRILSLAGRLEELIGRRRALADRRAQKTKVEFFTLARGDNDE
ncbi:MAG: phosphonate C-P lyase system protein PhnG [Deltaproteobacteria bacterium]|nr:phosphonate C-P lyase system protein PhnG [Deltaproteobacteria bacterium]